MKEELLRELIDGAYKCACRHGFHGKDLSIRHFLMLIITEISEADYGFPDHRRITGIECLAVEEWSYSDNSKQRFSEDTCNLVIASDTSCDERFISSIIKK